ncbi:YceI family protein [Kaistella montana]|uniref:YceI family protein n=1 Tax=Kaistella montana TaxID=1849733 RepID=A0ABW5K7M9_9FLAO|nr:YceI family protein [Kaistella montana]MCQ4034978.1 YceI family protein [Kaistella montana]
MKNKIIILLFSIIPILLFSQNNGVVINGWTNVNTFKCANDNFKNSGSIYSFTGNQLPNVQLQVTDFDCRNKMMTSDFRKILNAEKYPVLNIKFLDFDKAPANKFTALVEVKMMNVTRKYTIEFSKNNHSLVGNKRLKFSDFNIVPPKKMGGMIYVKNDIDLLFSLAIKD